MGERTKEIERYHHTTDLVDKSLVQDRKDTFLQQLLATRSLLFALCSLLSPQHQTIHLHSLLAVAMAISPLALLSSSVHLPSRCLAPSMPRHPRGGKANAICPPLTRRPSAPTNGTPTAHRQTLGAQH